MLNKKMIIWGAGRYGEVAFHYYKKQYEIISYVDWNSKKWGSELNGVVINDPDKISFADCDVAIALKNDYGRVHKYLEKINDIGYIYIFGIRDEILSIGNENIQLPERAFFVSFGGGLGNQMFQYALFRCLEREGNTVFANIDRFKKDDQRSFVLPGVFQKLKFNYASSKDEDKYRDRISKIDSSKKFVDYVENINVAAKKKTPLYLLEFDSGIIKGVHISSFFADRIRDVLIDDLVFDYQKESALVQMKKKINATSSVSIHFRRKDYISNGCIYGDICTLEYYKQAIAYIKKKVGNPTFFVFSDDIDYIEANYKIPEAIYIKAETYSDYEDWYDMFLMSQCKHNIIANSTFSWWGAWLNTNKEKIVIAPDRWINLFDSDDIYPNDWVQIDEKGNITKG